MHCCAAVGAGELAYDGHGRTTVGFKGNRPEADLPTVPF